MTGNPSPWMYTFTKVVTGLWFRLFRMRILGRENVPTSGGAIVAANHIHFLDPFAVGQPFRRPVYFMTKKELFANFLTRWFFRSGNGFPVDRSKADLSAIKTSLRILGAGEVLVLFPSGHRGSNDARGGVGFLASRAKVPVVPVGIARHGERYVLIFGDPIPPLPSADEMTEQVQVAMDDLRARAAAR